MRAGTCFLMAAAALVAASPAAGGPAWEAARAASVTDGDTFRLTTGERIRIAGIDAPETQPDQAHCPAEIALGRAATLRARALILNREIAVQRIGRSWNRTVARVRVGGRDAGAALVAAGAARWWPRGARKPDWCGGRLSARPR